MNVKATKKTMCRCNVRCRCNVEHKQISATEVECLGCGNIKTIIPYNNPSVRRDGENFKDYKSGCGLPHK